MRIFLLVLCSFLIANDKKVSVGYLGSWNIWKDYKVENIPAKSLTHIIYSFGYIGHKGEILFDDK